MRLSDRPRNGSLKSGRPVVGPTWVARRADIGRSFSNEKASRFAPGDARRVVVVAASADEPLKARMPLCGAAVIVFLRAGAGHRVFDWKSQLAHVGGCKDRPVETAFNARASEPHSRSQEFVRIASAKGQGQRGRYRTDVHGVPDHFG